MLGIIIGMFAVCATLLVSGILLLRDYTTTKRRLIRVIGIILVAIGVICFIGLAAFCWLFIMPAPVFD